MMNSEYSKERDIVLFFCPPLANFPEQPADQSKCEAVDCPRCGKKMWLSENKKNMIKLALVMDKEVIKLCYICFAKAYYANPELKNFIGIDLIDTKRKKDKTKTKE